MWALYSKRRVFRLCAVILWFPSRPSTAVLASNYLALSSSYAVVALRWRSVGSSLSAVATLEHTNAFPVLPVRLFEHWNVVNFRCCFLTDSIHCCFVLKIQNILHMNFFEWLRQSASFPCNIKLETARWSYFRSQNLVLDLKYLLSVMIVFDFLQTVQLHGHIPRCYQA